MLTDYAHSYVEALRARIRELEEAAALSEPPVEPPSPPASETVRMSQPVSEQIVSLGHQADSPSRDYQIAGRNGEAAPSSTDRTLSDSNHLSFTPSSGNEMTFSSNQMPNGRSNSFSLNLPEDRGSQDSADEDEECVGIGVMGTLSGSLCHKCRGLIGQRSDYCGPSSVVDFDRQIRYWTMSPASDRHGISYKENAEPKICHCSASHSTASPLLDTELSIPRRASADTLIESYFERAHGFYPFLHRPTFMQSYLQLWQPKSTQKGSNRGAIDDRLFHCLLNAVFALGSRFSPSLDATERISTSEVFYHRVINSLNFKLVESGSLELVQTLLLTAQYLQSTQMWGMCWNIVGFAVRVAQGLGLHLNPPDFAKHSIGKPSNTLDEEMRRRVWGGCVTLDRYVCCGQLKNDFIHFRAG
jgi:hypothetical protein